MTEVPTTENMRWLLANAGPEIGWPEQAFKALADITKVCEIIESQGLLRTADDELKRVTQALEQCLSFLIKYNMVNRDDEGILTLRYPSHSDDGWQPIETAPKDGRKILLAKFVGHPAHETCCWWVASASWSVKWNKFWDGVEPSGFAEPTHWMEITKRGVAAPDQR